VNQASAFEADIDKGSIKLCLCDDTLETHLGFQVIDGLRLGLSLYVF
jgi:hypothetical protein